jgi:hypothetical protein
VLGFDAAIGFKPEDSGSFDDCTTVWDGLSFLHSVAQDLMITILQIQQSVASMAPSVGETRIEEIVRSQVDSLDCQINHAFGQRKTDLQSISALVQCLNQEQEKLTNSFLNQGTPSNSLMNILMKEVQ